MGRSILLTGGTGLLGKHLTEALLSKGHTVSHLSRTEGKDPRVKTYLWDINKNIIDPACIDGVDTIVHLAGAGIADKRWTEARKKEIIESRTKSIGLVYDLLRDKPHTVASVISASGIGYYSDRGNTLLTEDSSPANDFLGTCCVAWEDAVDAGIDMGLRVLKFRTGVVLDKQGGALPTLAMPVKLFIGAPIGSGKQWVPWIHWHDAIAMYVYGIEHKNIKGVFNMVSPYPVTNKQLSKAVARQLHRPLWPINVPAFALKLALGEMSAVVLGSTKVSAEKIEGRGFKFTYPLLEQALKEIYGS
jgi:uncharacterized protein (TIGR01777 family)